jgi:hypothetical protein
LSLAQFWAVKSSNGGNRPIHSSTGPDHSSRTSEAKLFGIEFSDLHVSKEDSVKPRCDQLDAQLFEAEYLADENSVLVPADVAAIVDSSQQETRRVRELWQLARQSDRTGDVETCWNLVVQALVRALVIEHVAKVIEAALLCAKRCRRRFCRVLLILSVFDFEAEFSIPDKPSRGTTALEGASRPPHNPENLEHFPYRCRPKQHARLAFYVKKRPT